MPPSVFYTRGKYEVGTLDLRSADLRLMLVKSSYVFSPLHNFVADVSSHEITLVGYVRKPLTNKVVIEDDGLGFSYLDADDVAFGSLPFGQTIGGGILYRSSTSDLVSPLLVFVNVADYITAGVPVTVRWATPANGGVIKLT